MPQAFTSCLMKAMLWCGNALVLDGVDQSDVVQIATHQYHLDYCRCWVLRLCGNVQSSDHYSWAVPCVCYIRLHYIQIPHKIYLSVETMLRDYFYCCTVHFDDSITFIHQLMYLYICYQSLKHFVHLIAPTCFDTQRVIIRELYFPG
jgi:hypothetical protein